MDGNRPPLGSLAFLGPPPRGPRNLIARISVPKEQFVAVLEILTKREVSQLYSVKDSKQPDSFLIEFYPFVPMIESLKVKPQLEQKGCTVFMGR